MYLSFYSALKDDPLHVNPSKEEWAEIIGMTDLLFNNFLTDLRNKYSITRHEQEICCLIKSEFLPERTQLDRV